MELFTNRIHLRELNRNDVDAVQSYASNINNILFLPWGPNSTNDTINFIEKCIETSKVKPRISYNLAICRMENDIERLIGACLLNLNQEMNEGTLGWALHLDEWNKGYMTETGRKLLEFAFEKLKLHRVIAKCNVDNHGSYRVMEKIGMRREAHFRKASYGRDNGNYGWYDSYLYAILEEEWAAAE